jgi:hypothetical protein
MLSIFPICPGYHQILIMSQHISIKDLWRWRGTALVMKKIMNHLFSDETKKSD